MPGLYRTLESFRKQSNIQNILVLSNYKHKEVERIKVSFKHLNLNCFEIDGYGIYNAMNFGLNKVSTQYFMCLNGGDRLLDLENLNKLLGKIAGNKWGYGAVKIINPFGGFQRIYKFNRYSILVHRFSLKYVPHPSVIMDTAYARKLGGFDEKFKVSADQKLMMKFGMNFDPVVSKEVISEFYLGGNSTRSQLEVIADFKAISKDLFEPIFGSRHTEILLWNIISKLRVFLGKRFRKV